jgi:peptidoglycan L-alanyl-D-glutamate endopeptidase CwlK
MDLQALFYEVIKSFDCMILEGYRNQFDQDLAFKEKRSHLQWPNGKHNGQPSMAVDVTPFPVDFNNIKRIYWFGGYVMGIAQKLKDEGKMTHSVRFGGDCDRDYHIDDQAFYDLQHFELVE